MTRASRGQATVRTMLAGGGSFVTASFALLVLVCVFIAMAAPRADAGFRTRALQRAFAAAPERQKSVVADANWEEFADAVGQQSGSGVPGSAPVVTPAQLGQARAELARALAATRLPVAPRPADWSSMTTAFSPLAHTVPSAATIELPQVELIYRDALAAHSRLVSGRLPTVSSARHGGAASTTFEIAVTPATAARFSLRAGSRMVVANGVTLLVTGIVQPVVPASAFWTLDSVAAAPSLVQSRFGDPLYWKAGVFVGPGETADLQHLFGSQVDLKWDFPLVLGGVGAEGARTLADELNRAVSESTSALSAAGTGVPLGTVSLSSDMITLLASFLDTQSAVQALLGLVYTSMTVLGAVALLLAVRLLAARRHGELTLMRARGAALWQVAALATGGAALAALPAAAAGAAAAIAVPGGRGSGLSWWLGAVIVGVPLAGLPLIVVRSHRRVDPAGERRPARAARARRWVAEGAVTVAAVGALVLLRQHGAAGGVNLYTSAAPVLVAAPAALFVMWLYPLVFRAVLRLSSARAGPAAFVGLATVARAALTSALPTFALILALAVAAFGGMTRAAVARGQVTSSWYSTGGDARIDLSDPTPQAAAAAQHAAAATPGARHSAAAVEASGSSGFAAVDVFAVDPARYASLTADTPLPRIDPALLTQRAGSGGPVPVLASPAAAAALRANSAILNLDTGQLAVRITGTVAATPALPWGGAFVLMSRSALPGGRPPNLILITGPHLAQTRLTAALNGISPGAVVTFRSAVLAGLANAPLQHGAYVILAAAIVAAAGLSMAVLLLGFALGARPRELTLAKLATMGLGTAQARVLVAAETMPGTLAAAAAGAACAWVLAPLTGPALDLSGFTGSGQPVAVQPDVLTLVLPAVGLVALCLAALAAQTAITSGRRTVPLLRVGG